MVDNEESEGDVVAQMKCWLGVLPPKVMDTCGKPLQQGDKEWMDQNWDKIYRKLMELYEPTLGDFSKKKWCLVRGITNVEEHRNACSEMIAEIDEVITNLKELEWSSEMLKNTVYKK
jgi:hypothetical protein